MILHFVSVLRIKIIDTISEGRSAGFHSDEFSSVGAGLGTCYMEMTIPGKHTNGLSLEDS